MPVTANNVPLDLPYLRPTGTSTISRMVYVLRDLKPQPSSHRPAARHRSWAGDNVEVYEQIPGGDVGHTFGQVSPTLPAQPPATDSSSRSESSALPPIGEALGITRYTVSAVSSSATTPISSGSRAEFPLHSPLGVI